MSKTSAGPLNIGKLVNMRCCCKIFTHIHVVNGLSSQYVLVSFEHLFHHMGNHVKFRYFVTIIPYTFSLFTARDCFAIYYINCIVRYRNANQIRNWSAYKTTRQQFIFASSPEHIRWDYVSILICFGFLLMFHQ